MTFQFMGCVFEKTPLVRLCTPLTSVPAYYSCTNLKCSDKKTSKGQSFNATTHFGRIVTEQKGNEKARIETKPWRCDDRVLLTSKRRFSHHQNVHRHTLMTFGHIRLRRHISFNLRTLNACIKAEIFKRITLKITV